SLSPLTPLYADGPPPSPLTTSPVKGGFLNAGLDAEYFSNSSLTEPSSFMRRDLRIDFDWGTTIAPGGSISAGYRDVGVDNFSVRWIGTLAPCFSETYTFKISSSGGVRLYLRQTGAANWTTLIDDWTPHSLTDDTAQLAMTSNTSYDIRLEYRKISGPGVL